MAITATATNLVIPGFKLIPAGPCQLGAKHFPDNPVRTVHVSDFYEAEAPATHCDYSKYVQESSGRPPYAVELQRKSGTTEIVAELSAEAAMAYQVEKVTLDDVQSLVEIL